MFRRWPPTWRVKPEIGFKPLSNRRKLGFQRFPLKLRGNWLWANDTIVSLKQQNEMLARQQQDLCGQIATLQNMVAEVKASAVNTSVPQIPTTQNGAEITEALKAMASRVGQTMNALKEAVIGSPKAKGRSKVAKAPIPYFSSPPPYACERSSSVSFDKWGTFINAHCLCSTEICL